MRDDRPMRHYQSVSTSRFITSIIGQSTVNLSKALLAVSSPKNSLSGSAKSFAIAALNSGRRGRVLRGGNTP
jgi:hypothetical protein